MFWNFKKMFVKYVIKRNMLGDKKKINRLDNLEVFLYYQVIC